MPLLLASGDGAYKTVLNISSIGAFGYQTSKLAVCRLAEFLQTEYADRGLLSVAVHPGGVSTELARGMPSELHATLNDTPELAADFFVFLVHARMGWLGGRYLSVTWDVDELVQKKEEIVKGDLLKVRLAVGF